MRRVNQFYVVSDSDEEPVKFLAYDEYDSNGSGDFWTRDLDLVTRYVSSEARRVALAKGKGVWIVTITKDDGADTSNVDAQPMFLASEIQEDSKLYDAYAALVKESDDAEKRVDEAKKARALL